MADEREIPKIRTMRSDAAELIKDRKISPLDITTRQYVSQNRERKIRFEELPFKTIAIFSVAILVLSIGGYFGYKIFTKQFPNPQEPVLEKQKPPAKIVSADDEKIISFQEALPGELIYKINNERARLLRFGTILYIPIEIDRRVGSKKFIDSSNLIKSLSWRAGSAFSDNIFPEFNALITYAAASRDFSILLKIRDFKRAVGSLIEWESTMGQDFKPFLVEEDARNLNQFFFYDAIIKNNDARVLKNSSEKIILAYAIFNKQFLIISTSREGLALILDRLIKLPPR